MSAVGTKLGVFTLAMVALGGALAYPAGLWGGDSGRIALLAAWLLSVVPGWAILAAQALVKSPEQGVFLALGSTVGRLLFVGFGALILFSQQLLPEQQLAVWIVVCYLAALGVETGLVLRRTAAGESPAAGFAHLLNLGGR